MSVEPPHDLDTERAVLGALLERPALVAEVIEVVSRDDFFSADHRDIFGAVLALYARGETADAVTVRAELNGRGAKLRNNAGPAYLVDLLQAAPNPASAPKYAAAVADLADQRRAISVAQDVIRAAQEGGEWRPAVRGLLGSLEGTDPPPRRRRLEVLDVAEVAARVESAGPPSWLVEPLMPAGSYGVIGAEDKAGKTFAALDLAVSVLTATPWLGRFPCPFPGSVLAFLGEGGERAMLRRLLAIVGDRGGDLRDLAGLRMCFAVPQLLDRSQLAEVEAEIEATAPRLVILDPLYLAAAGAKGSDLYGMGEVLGAVQTLTQSAGCSLVVVTHWNKTGEGAGAKRFTGVGPGAWGRFLGSAAVERRAKDGNASDVQLRWQFVGSEIPDTSFRTKRHVSVEDPTDLASPMRYSIEVIEDEGDPESDSDLSRSARRIATLLPGQPPGITVQEIGDGLAEDGQGPPLKRTTIQGALKQLDERGLVDAELPGNGLPNRWWKR